MKPLLQHPAAPLISAFEKTILPSMKSSVWNRTVIAAANLDQLHAPQQVGVITRKRRGRRVAVRTSGLFERAAVLTGRWPSDGLRELRVPKLAFVTSGEAGFRVADYILHCPAGTAILLPPGVAHSDGTLPHNDAMPENWKSCTMLWLTPLISGLGCRMCHSEGELHSGPREGERVFFHSPRLLQLFTVLCEEASTLLPEKRATQNDPSAFEHLFLGFLHSLLRDLRNEEFFMQGTPLPQDAELRLDEPIAQAEQYIRSHYMRALTIDEVARAVFMSRAQFTRKFREHTNQSFLQFLNERRLDHARRLLLETEWTAAMIGQAVGYRSPTHFHRAFQQSHHLSPMEYRRQQRGNT